MSRSLSGRWVASRSRAEDRQDGDAGQVVGCLQDLVVKGWHKVDRNKKAGRRYDTICGSMNAPRVVLDTNVLISAFRSRRGPASALVSRIGSGSFEISVSVPLVLEMKKSCTGQRAWRTWRSSPCCDSSAPWHSGRRSSTYGVRFCPIPRMTWCSNWRSLQDPGSSSRTTSATSYRPTGSGSRR